MLGNFFKNLVGANGNALYDQIAGRSLVENIFLIGVAVLFSFPLIEWVSKKIDTNRRVMAIGRAAAILCCAGLLIVSSIMLVNTTDSPFLYLQW